MKKRKKVLLNTASVSSSLHTTFYWSGTGIQKRIN